MQTDSGADSVAIDSLSLLTWSSSLPILMQTDSGGDSVALGRVSLSPIFHYLGSLRQYRSQWSSK